MATQPPLTRVVLAATSVADDLGYVALGDLANVLGTSTYRIIGGHMVTALVARWQLGAELYRETGDTDLGLGDDGDGVTGRVGPGPAVGGSFGEFVEGAGVDPVVVGVGVERGGVAGSQP
jgi:hypothetical protein